VIGEEKLHGSAPDPGVNQFARNNQAFLKDKSSARQSFSGVPSVFSAVRGADDPAQLT
jgi:hypothetical protein